jgi:signal recognition particle subunit SRP54
MFEGITKSIGDALSVFRRSGKLTEANIREGLRQVRQALLEADVNYDVAEQFVDRVTEKAVGEEVLASLNPSEQIVYVVYQELVALMGPVDHSLGLKRDGVTVLMMCGLQGSGKTTTCGKLALSLKEQGRRPLLVAADLQRPAAIEQLKVIGQQIGVPVYAEPPEKSSPVQVCRNGLAEAKRSGANVLILDTAGRLHVDDALMAELRQIDERLEPDQALLVCDAMTGQDAVNSARAFNDSLELDGVILTKLDGDTRGGAALSVKAVTGVPIKYVGVGEQLDKLQEFHPERMAGRILGGGDIATLIDMARSKIDQIEAEEAQRKLVEGRFTLDDFRKQMGMVKKLGSMGDIMKLIPGMGSLAEAMADSDPDKDLRRIEAMISSMTLDERQNPDKIDRSRRQRVAKGSGTDPADVHKLLKDFKAMAGVMQQMAGKNRFEQLRAIRQMGEAGMFDPDARLKQEKQRSKRGPVDKNKLRDKKKQHRKEVRKQRKRGR